MVEVSDLPRNPRRVRKDPIIETQANVQAGTSSLVLPCDDAPQPLGLTASSGTSEKYSRCDHVHPITGLIGERFWFGSGIDGTLTLSGDTTLASLSWCKQYSALDLAGHTLTQTSSDKFIVIYVSGTLTLGGGTIKSSYVSETGTAGGNGDTGHNPSGYGGAGGAGTGAVYVCAKTISGTGTITAAGVAGTAGNAATAIPAAQVNGGTGSNHGATNGSTVFSTVIATGSFNGGGGATGGGT